MLPFIECVEKHRIGTPEAVNIIQGAADGSPYVRQAAAQAVPKLVLMDPTLLGSLLEGVLLRLIGDIEVSDFTNTQNSGSLSTDICRFSGVSIFL